MTAGMSILRDHRAGFGLLALWLLVAALGMAGIAHQSLGEQRNAFDTDARIAHRVLSQRMVQHDAILATLALLQPGGSESLGPEHRLPALYPQVLSVLRREAGGRWPELPLQAAEDTSRRQQRAALGSVDFAQGRYWLVRASEPTSFALRIDLKALVAAEDWPYATSSTGSTGSPVQALIVHEGRQLPLSGTTLPASAPWRFAAAKQLASESQAFELRVAAVLGWADLPWLVMLSWAAASGLTLLGARALWRQRAEQRRARELLRLGQVGRLNALGELAAGIAHELNQPLTAVLANTQAAARLLAEDEAQLPTARHAMAQAAQQAQRAADVLARLRRLIERPDAGAAPQPLPVAPQIERALDLLRDELRRLGLRPTLSVQPPGLAVMAEPVALEQILHNLLGNALHALAQVPEAERGLTIEARAKSERVRISVRDSGPGIASEVLPRLFEPFVSSREGGLGLGLSLSDTLASAMGGALSGGNAAPRGAEFRLELPAAPTS